MNLVVDSSITLAWYFKDEQTPASRAVLRQVADEGAMVPTLWRFEVANGFQTAIRRRRIDAAFRDRALGHLATLPIVADPESHLHVWSASLRLADRHALTVYDAAYLELAQRRRTELATLDAALIEAARAEQVPVLGS